MVPVIFPSTCKVIFSLSVHIFNLELVVLFLLSIVFFLLAFKITIAYLFRQNFFPILWLYILIILYRPLLLPLLLLLNSFSHQRQLMVFHWSLSDSKSPQVFRTLHSILAVLNNVVVWMVSIPPPTSKSSSPFNSPLVTVPNAPITIGIIVTFMFNRFFFNSLSRSRWLYFFSLFSVLFCGQPLQQSRQFCKF